MSIITTLLLGIAFSFYAMAQPLPPTTAPAIDESRTVHIDKVIKGNYILEKTEELNKLTKESKDPISLVLNSPGGSVYAGLQFINSMIAAQAEGVKIRCFVPGMAASMAFQILLFCDERYALTYSLLLWHPPRISGSFLLTPKRARDIAKDLETIEASLVEALRSKLFMIPEEVFFFHYYNETFHLGTDLENLTSGRFIKVVKVMPGIDLGASARKMLNFQKQLKEDSGE